MQNPKHAGLEARKRMVQSLHYQARGRATLLGCWLWGFGLGSFWWVALVQRGWEYKFPTICQVCPVGPLGYEGGSGGASWCDCVVWFVVVAGPLGLGVMVATAFPTAGTPIAGNVAVAKHETPGAAHDWAGDGVQIPLVTVVEASMWSPGEAELVLEGLGPGRTTVSTRGITSTASSSLSVVYCTVCSAGGDA
ncbi:hypothetical protein E2C01_052988 [Portunus trituberculatus]|uniref:Uncharacterized protein n=1 Tax=Portunus trituberculatus TaxID=210409 RepID=A0A5B7GN51_PORTR|nr:hypothetical protein [Portunus trituberculatus]